MNLEFYRKQKNLTQEQLGKALGVTKQTVWKWENGKAPIHAKYFSPLKEILGISITELSNIYREAPAELFVPKVQLAHINDLISEYEKKHGDWNDDIKKFLYRARDIAEKSSDKQAKLMDLLDLGELKTKDISQKISQLPDTIKNTPELLLCIKNAMMKKGITTDEELCKLIGYDSIHSLSRLMAGKLNWFPDMLSAVFAVLEIDHDKVPISPTERELLSPASLFREETILTAPIPIVDWADAASYIDSVAATSPTMRKWDPESTKTIVVPVGKRKGTFAFKIHGQSMEPLINDEDIILCKQQNLSEIPSGKVVAARLLDDDGFSDRLVCKRIKRMSEKIILRSDNPAGEDFEVSPEKICWIGLVTGKHVDF